MLRLLRDAVEEQLSEFRGLTDTTAFERYKTTETAAQIVTGKQYPLEVDLFIGFSHGGGILIPWAQEAASLTELLLHEDTYLVVGDRKYKITTAVTLYVNRRPTFLLCQKENYDEQAVDRSLSQ